MSSWAKIAIQNMDGSIEYTSCRHDGYALGEILSNAYEDEQKVRDLIALGEIWSLGKAIHPDPLKPHLINKDFSQRQKGVTLATFRDWDRESGWNKMWEPNYSKSYRCKNLSVFLENYAESWNYIYQVKNKRWVYSENI